MRHATAACARDKEFQARSTIAPLVVIMVITSTIDESRGIPRGKTLNPVRRKLVPEGEG